MNIYVNELKIAWGIFSLMLKKHKNSLLVLFGFFLFLTLFFRNSAGIYPGLLDEFYYSQSARLLPFSDARYGNFLFHLIYRSTNSCGANFLTCAYFLNAMFYLATFFPIYWIALRFTTSNKAIFLGVLSIMMPFNYWTAFFMPEASVFFFFWIFVWFIFFSKPKFLVLKWAMAGVLLGIGASVKVHLLFVMPAIILYIIFSSGEKKLRLITRLFLAVSFIFCAILTKIFIGYIIAGSSGLSLFGTYGNFSGITKFNEISPSSAGEDTNRYFSPVAIWKRDGPTAILINILPVFIFFGTGIAIILDGLSNAFVEAKKKLASSLINNIYLLSFLIVTILVSGISAFQLMQMGLGEGRAELYWRYYEYTFPLFIISAGIQIKNIRANIEILNQRIVIGVFVLFFVILGIYRGAGSDLISQQINGDIYFLVAFISMISIVFWMFNPNFGRNIFLFALLPVIAIVANIEIIKRYEASRFTPNQSNVGMYLNGLLTKKDLSRLVIVQDTHLTQTVPLIYLNKAPLTIMEIPKDQIEVDLDLLPSDKDWILLMGNHQLVGERIKGTHMEHIAFGDATLFGGHGNLDIDFKRSEWRGLIDGVDGLFIPPEPWGAWSTSQKISIRFSRPLPRRFNLVLNARAFGPNRNMEFGLLIGNELKKFKVSSFPEFEDISLLLDNPNKLSIMSILIPQPIAPADLGVGSDTRMIGLGLTSMRLTW